MKGLRGKKIVVGVTGGIAAYKTPFIVRSFIKAGAEVRVILTSDAASFVSPLTLSTLSKNEVYTSFYKENHQWNNHIEIALWADALLFAPLTANTLSKFAHGLCDELLHAVYLSAKCPVFFAPAMDLDMYAHPTTRDNIQRLKSYGAIEIEAQEGELASGLFGKGRMEEPEVIVQRLHDFFSSEQLFSGKKILITAGPTYEPIDPVRFVGNHSSGKMGFEIAEAAANMGAEVILVSGPTTMNIQHPNVALVRVQTALEMLSACEKVFDTVDVFIAAAAVADYRPNIVATEKIKKEGEEMQIAMRKNPDILQTLSLRKKTQQKVIGFALETQNEIEQARAKLERKKLDMIVLNSLRDEGAGFQTSTNKVTFITENTIEPQPLLPKTEVARQLLIKIDTL